MRFRWFNSVMLRSLFRNFPFGVRKPKSILSCIVSVLTLDSCRIISFCDLPTVLYRVHTSIFEVVYLSLMFLVSFVFVLIRSFDVYVCFVSVRARAGRKGRKEKGDVIFLSDHSLPSVHTQNTAKPIYRTESIEFCRSVPIHSSQDLFYYSPIVPHRQGWTTRYNNALSIVCRSSFFLLGPLSSGSYSTCTCFTNWKFVEWRDVTVVMMLLLYQEERVAVPCHLDLW